MATTIAREELQALLGNDAVALVEALPVMQFVAGHLAVAVNVPDQVTPDLAVLIAPDAARTVMDYCSGPARSRSKVTAAQFERLGYTDVRVYPGGKSDWSDAGPPLVCPHATGSGAPGSGH